ncbi:McrC family protein [Sorangium sp. So ce1000]|uniref:McrC family protein n=1 Tax=Sorangium sp. So ce1000 TaxID=3133325 RepID=UPI003F5D5DDD
MTLLEIRLREWSTIEPGSAGSEPLAGRRLDGPDSRRLAEELRQARLLDIEELASGLRVRSFSHVGRVRVGDIVVTIEPKLEPGALLDLFRYAYGLRNLRLFAPSPSDASGRLLQDLLVTQLLAEMNELLERGLARRYVERTERLSAPRGRLDFLALARTGTPRVDLMCSHHPRSADHLLNRVLGAGVALAAKIAEDAALRLSLRRLQARLGVEIAPVALSRGILAEARRGMNRLVSAYEPALRLTELLYAGCSASLDADDSVRVPGFLFDMNRFFQALVSRWLRDHLDDFVVRDERALRGMMRYAPGKNPRQRRAPTPRPDFLVLRGTKPLVLLDAKYRDLWSHDLPREMLYQLGMYALSHVGEGTAAIIYPTAASGALESVIEIHEAAGGTTAGYVALRPMVLPRLVELLADDRSGAARRALAWELAFGAPRHDAGSFS